MWNGLCSVLAPVFEGVFQHISDIFTFVTDTILSVLDVFIGLFSGNWKQCWSGILTDIKETTSEFNRLLCANTSSQPITRKIVLAMIDSITVYDEKTMEIKFTFDDIGKRAVEYISEHKIDIGDI